MKLAAGARDARPRQSEDRVVVLNVGERTGGPPGLRLPVRRQGDNPPQLPGPPCRGVRQANFRERSLSEELMY
jgi:hypothetical protein